MIDSRIARINELYRKSKAEGLTEAEKAELIFTLENIIKEVQEIEDFFENLK